MKYHIKIIKDGRITHEVLSVSKDKAKKWIKSINKSFHKWDDPPKPEEGVEYYILKKHIPYTHFSATIEESKIVVL